MKSIIAGLFKSYIDSSWVTDCAYLAIIEHISGCKSFGYLVAKECEDEGLSISLSKVSLDYIKLKNPEQYEILELAVFDELNTGISKALKSVELQKSLDWITAKQVITKDDQKPSFGWAIVELKTPEIEAHERNDGSIAGDHSNKITTSYELAYVTYGHLSDNEDAEPKFGIEFYVAHPLESKLEAVTLLEQPPHYEFSTIERYALLSLNDILALKSAKA